MKNLNTIAGWAGLVLGVVALILVSGSGGNLLGGLVEINRVQFQDGFETYGDTVFNQEGRDKDLRVEGDTDTEVLFVDASTDRVGISTLTPSVPLEVAGAVLFGITNSLQSATTTDSVNFTLTAAQSGHLILIKGTGAAYTLPAVSNTGATYTFSVLAAFGTNAVITSAAGDDINGSLFVNDAIVVCSAADVITFVADGETIGDFVTIVSDGTNWNIVNSRGETAAKITCTG